MAGSSPGLQSRQNAARDLDEHSVEENRHISSQQRGAGSLEFLCSISLSSRARSPSVGIAWHCNAM